MTPAEVTAWNAALDAASAVEYRQGFRVTAERIRSLKKPVAEPVREIPTPEPAYVPDFRGVLCKGSFALGTACGKCPRCQAERFRL